MLQLKTSLKTSWLMKQQAGMTITGRSSRSDPGREREEEKEREREREKFRYKYCSF